VVLHQAEGMEVPCQAAVGKVVSYLEGEILEALGNRVVEDREACLELVVGREAFLGKRPEAVACQGRRGAHLGESLAQEEPELEEPMRREQHMSAEWRHIQNSGLYRRGQVREFHARP
jgi:hypothetical protein